MAASVVASFAFVVDAAVVLVAAAVDNYTEFVTAARILFVFLT